MNLWRGSLYGHELLSDVALNWLDDAPVVDQSIRIRVVDTTEFRAFAVPEQTSEFPEPVVAFGTAPGGRLVCDLLSLGAFVLNPDSLEILAPEPTPKSAAVWEHTLYSWAMPFLLASSGRLLLHGAAIETKRGALLVVGESTRGKSSFASEAVRGGYRLLGEDGIAVRIDPGSKWPIAYAGCQGLRLRHGPDGRPRPKVTTALPAESRCSRPLPLAAVAALAPRTPSGTTPVVGGAAFALAALRSNCFAMPAALSGLYPVMAAVARSVPVVSVALRDGLEHLGSEVERLVSWTESNGGPPDALQNRTLELAS